MWYLHYNYKIYLVFSNLKHTNFNLIIIYNQMNYFTKNIIFILFCLLALNSCKSDAQLTMEQGIQYYEYGWGSVQDSIFWIRRGAFTIRYSEFRRRAFKIKVFHIYCKYWGWTIWDYNRIFLWNNFIICNWSIFRGLAIATIINTNVNIFR